MSPGRARWSWLPSAFLAAALAGAGGACLVAPRVRVVPAARAASAALQHAEELRRAAELPAHEEVRAAARAELERALELDPGWIAPQRLLDDMQREELRGAEALERARARLVGEPEDAAALYLAGRLEGREGSPRFELALRIDPNLAWACNGMAWTASSENRSQEALLYARQALARARDPYERGYFTIALARQEAAAGRREEALERLDARGSAVEASAVERIELRVLRASLALASARPERVREGYEDGLRLLGGEPVSEREISELGALLRAAATGDGGRLIELSSALARGSSPARDRLRAELLLESGPSPLALGLLERAQAAQGGAFESALLRGARFAAGEGLQAVERWLTTLPQVVREADGLPRDERLRAVVLAARACSSAADPALARAVLGDALCDAGWFTEARAVAGELARADFERALSIEARAEAGLSAFSGLRRCMQEVDRDRAGSAVLAHAGSSSLSGSAATLRAARSPVRDLDGLLERMDVLFAPTRPSGAPAKLRDSPRLSFGFIGELVHPGPRFSAADERAGLGQAGATVGGLAADMLRLHRFGLFGEMSGSGPDGALLPLLELEQRSGEHMGVHWAGAVALCESADLEPAAARAGAGIAGAALHEGYWIDVDALRLEQAHWLRLAREYSGAAGEARRAQLLAFEGLAVRARDDEERSRLRCAQGALLGQADRLRLARIAQDGVPALDELVAVASTHEEGHLCDRTRFLPLSRHLPRALGFLLDCGGSPSRVMERLEYRAQLVACVDAADPRVPLAQVLEAAENVQAARSTPHAAAYAELLHDLLARLDREFSRNPQTFPGLSPDRTLAQQLHRLGPEVLRGLLRGLAHEKRLDRD